MQPEITRVNTNSQINWQQAQAARSSGNWSLLIQYLQQLILGDRQPPAIAESEDLSEINAGQNPTRSHLLDMALEVLVAGDFHQRWDIAKLLPKLGQKPMQETSKQSLLH